MQTNNVPNKATICACSSRSFIDNAKVALIASTLKGAGYDINIEADLCKTAIADQKAMLNIANTTIIACHPRAINAMFAKLNLQPKQALDIRNNDCDTIVKELNITNTPTVTENICLPTDSGQEAWYPIIDKERCSECGKCHDFCLFGVYSIVDKKVIVSQPQNCKNNCPACARICPQKAVIFPKYEKSPINGGLIDEEQATEIDTKALYANALKLKLEQRKAGISLLKNNTQ